MGETTKEERARVDSVMKEAVEYWEPGDMEKILDYPRPSLGFMVRVIAVADRCEELERENAFLVDRRMVLSAHYEQHTARITEIEAEIERLRGELETERRLHAGDHEILEAVTGLKGTHLWSPAQAEQWATHRITELEADAADWRQQYLDSCARRDAAIDRLKAEVHQRDEWLDRAKARYEIQAKENARILEDYVATVSGLRGHVERLEAEPRFECWNCGKMNCKTGVCMDCWHSDNPELDAAKAENERLRAGVQRAADGCRREAKEHGDARSHLTSAYAAATARHLDSLLPSKGDG